MRNQKKRELRYLHSFPGGVICFNHTVWWFRNPKQPSGMVLKPCTYWDKLPFPQLVNCALQICNLPSMGDRIQISTKSIPPMCVLMSIIPLFCILHDTWQSMATWSVTCRASHWPWRKSGWPPPRTAENQVDVPPNWSRVWLLYKPPCQ